MLTASDEFSCNFSFLSTRIDAPHAKGVSAQYSDNDVDEHGVLSSRDDRTNLPSHEGAACLSWTAGEVLYLEGHMCPI
jgi:hypothetical protein